MEAARKKEIGSWGEQQAARYLRRKGYRILARNFSCRFGEIDLIAADRAYLVFVEVKVRKTADYGAAREFVTLGKQRRMIRTAEYYLAVRPTTLQPRFDVVEIYGSEGAVRELNHIENAFTL